MSKRIGNGSGGVKADGLSRKQAAALRASEEAKRRAEGLPPLDLNTATKDELFQRAQAVDPPYLRWNDALWFVLSEREAGRRIASWDTLLRRARVGAGTIEGLKEYLHFYID